MRKLLKRFVIDTSRFKFAGLPCGCLTWKHERKTKHCQEMCEQELGEIAEKLGSLDGSYNVWWNKDWNIERDWLCGKPMSQGKRK